MGESMRPAVERILAFSDEPVPNQVEIERITQALNSNALRLNFQPTVSLSESQEQRFEVRCGLDILAETLAPKRMFEIANKNQLGEPLDRWVAVQALKILQLNHQSEIRLIVSLGQESLQQRSYLDWLERQLRSMPSVAGRLTLQIRTSDFRNDGIVAQRFCKDLKRMGLTICLALSDITADDESYLQQLPADFVRLDAGCLMNLENESRKRMHLRKRITALHRLGIRVIATQLEDMLLLPILWKVGVDLVQGYCLQAPDQALRADFLHHQSITVH